MGQFEPSLPGQFDRVFHVLLLMTDKEINREDFLVGEQRFRIIAVSLAMVFEALFVHIADIHIDFY